MGGQTTSCHRESDGGRGGVGVDSDGDGGRGGGGLDTFIIVHCICCGLVESNSGMADWR